MHYLNQQLNSIVLHADLKFKSNSLLFHKDSVSKVFNLNLIYYYRSTIGLTHTYILLLKTYLLSWYTF
jgi:hypothetical protein